MWVLGNAKKNDIAHKQQKHEDGREVAHANKLQIICNYAAKISANICNDSIGLRSGALSGITADFRRD